MKEFNVKYNNILYTLDSETGLMSLKFKDNVLDGLNEKHKMMFREYILPMLAMNNKFILTGSLSLKLLGFEPMDEIGDFDFGLTDTFTEDEYNTLKNFFGLKDRKGDNEYSFEAESNGFDSKAHMWPFIKHIYEGNEDNNELFRPANILKIDIFNDEIIRPRDIIKVYFENFEIKLVHPSITWSYRMRYALDLRSSVTLKYWKRSKEFMDSIHKHYFKTLKNLQKMIMRVHEHNTNLENNKDRINRLRYIVTLREHSMDDFLKIIFDEGEEHREA